MRTQGSSSRTRASTDAGAPPLSAADTAARPPAEPPTEVPAVRAAAALGRADAHRLARHPMTLVGLVLCIPLVVEAHGQVNGAFGLLAGAGLLPLAAGACAAALLLGSRERRNGTSELWASMPTAPSVRTLGRAWSLLGPVFLAVGALGGMALATRAWSGVPVALQAGVVLDRPAAAELLQGPAVVLALGALGLAVGSWVGPRVLAPLAMAGCYVGIVVAGWHAEGWLRWALPLTHHSQEVVRWVQVTPTYGYGVVTGFDATALAWHNAYVLALAVLLVGVAVLREDRRPVVLGAVGGLAALTAVLSVVQVP